MPSISVATELPLPIGFPIRVLGSWHLPQPRSARHRYAGCGSTLAFETHVPSKFIVFCVRPDRADVEWRVRTTAMFALDEAHLTQLWSQAEPSVRHRSWRRQWPRSG